MRFCRPRALGYAAGGTVPTDLRDQRGIKTAEQFFEVRVLPDSDESLRLLTGQRIVVRIQLRPNRWPPRCGVSFVNYFSGGSMCSQPGQGLTLPSATWTMLNDKVNAERIPRGLDMVWHRLGGIAGRVVPGLCWLCVDPSRSWPWKKDFAGMTDAKLREAANQLRAVYRSHRDQPTDLNHALP